RYDLFRTAAEAPGDIVECGVFKGTGFLYWLKLLSIYQAGSAKRVIGFDTFSHFPEPDDAREKVEVDKLVGEASFRRISPAAIYAMAEAAGFPRSSCELVSGDIRSSAEDYVATHPGFRISLLHLDLDLGDATLAALEAFWPRVVRGGVVVFDEYAI